MVDNLLSLKHESLMIDKRESVSKITNLTPDSRKHFGPRTVTSRGITIQESLSEYLAMGISPDSP
jgi:hypothetical protein